MLTFRVHNLEFALCIFKVFSWQKHIVRKLPLLLKVSYSERVWFQSQPPAFISKAHSKLKIAQLQSTTSHEKFRLERTSSLCLPSRTTKRAEVAVSSKKNKKDECKHAHSVSFAKMKGHCTGFPTQGIG